MYVVCARREKEKMKEKARGKEIERRSGELSLFLREEVKESMFFCCRLGSTSPIKEKKKKQEKKKEVTNI